MFIQTEATPNPNTVKFIPGRSVSPDQALEYRSIDEATASPLAEGLFQVEGVAGVYLGDDYISVTRDAEGPDWGEMKPAVLAAVMDHFTSGRPVVTGEGSGAVGHAQTDDPIVQEIIELLDSRIRPAVAQDGGDILFDRFEKETGVLHLRMRGACAGCPSSTATLKAGIESMMRHYVPEVTAVEQAI